ncbi:MAG: group II truncated hemoglobin [Sulfuricella sp.]|nr:group II truncated hemoglobin [Sulfuricella sp.]
MPETPYHRVGGEAAIRRLVSRFYELMDELPEAYAARKIHPQDLGHSGEKFVMFLSGAGRTAALCREFGHPMLRRRHLPYPIGPRERDEWLMCMPLALDETIADAELRGQLYQAMQPIAEHMLNRGEGAGGCGRGH